MGKAGENETSVLDEGHPLPRDAHHDHAELVRTRSADLIRLAYLVTGDRERAIDVATSTLVSLRDEWSEVVQRGTPQAEARRDLVRRLLKATGRRTATPGPASFPATGADDGWVGGDHAAYGLDVDQGLDAVVLKAYAAEPAATRAAVVLREVDHVDTPAAAAALGLDPRVVEHGVEAASDRIARARQGAADDRDRDRPTEPVGAHLRRVLLDEGARAGLPLDLTEEVAARRQGTVKRRRLLTGAAGGLGLAAMGAVAVPSILRAREVRLSSAGATATTSTATSTLDGTANAPATLSWDAVWRWPARGSMLGDPRVADQVRGTLDRAIFAERVDDRIVVVTAARDTTSTDPGGASDQVSSTVSLHEITGAAADDDTQISFWVQGPQPLSFTTNQHGPGRMIVLAPPALTGVEVSSRVTFSVKGTRTRTDWRPVPLREGVGQLSTGRLGSTGWTTRSAGASSPPLGNDPNFGALQTVSGVPHRQNLWDAATIRKGVVGQIRDVAAVITGAPAAAISAEVSTETTVAGSAFPSEFPDQTAPEDTTPDTTILVVLTTLPGGARLRSVVLWRPRRVAESSPTVYYVENLAPYPAAGLARRPAVVPGVGNETALMALTAPGASAVRLAGVMLAPGQGSTARVVDGVAVFSYIQADDATITTLSSKGRKIAEWPFFWTPAGDPWALAT